MKPETLLVVAGEVSGDMHGAGLLEALHASRPGLEAFGMGGSALAAAGLDVVASSSEISVVGLVEALRILPRARRVFRRLLSEVDRRRPAVAVLIDSPDFNLRLARQLTRRGVRVVYYVSPQVWAWRSGRVKTIARYVERMLVLFGFEAEWYGERGVRAVHVGHPLVDDVPALDQAWDGDGAKPEAYRIALLPGSRRSEVGMLLAPMVEAVEVLARRFPIELSVIQAPDLPDDVFADVLRRSEVPIRLVGEGRHRAVAEAHLALCASGTATLEVGLLRTPMVVIYKVKRWSHLLGRMVIEVPHISLVNLVLGDRVVPELIQAEASPESIAEQASLLLTDRATLAKQRDGLDRLRAALGRPGASGRAAAEVLRLLEGAP